MMGAMNRRLRVLMAKAGLDGHDRGAKVIAKTLRDAGMEVIYLGLHQRPLQIVSAAIQEDVDVIALSILSGAHLGVCRKIFDELNKADAGDIVVIVGGTIIPEDVAALKEMGVAEVFPSGSPIDAGVDYLKRRFDI